MLSREGKKIKISWKKAQKVDFRILIDNFWGFTLKMVLGIHDPRISWLLFKTKNHEMRGPPVLDWWDKYVTPFISGFDESDANRTLNDY